MASKLTREEFASLLAVGNRTILNPPRRRGERPVYSALTADHPINDYCIITSLRIGHPDRWGWEIRRRSRPLGVKVTGDGYQSDTAAKFAGKQALADFLVALSNEEKRARK